jgi:hypothetical protein
LTKYGEVICIGALDLEGVKGNADSQRGRLAKTGSGETRDLFSIPITKREKKSGKNGGGEVCLTEVQAIDYD